MRLCVHVCFPPRQNRDTLKLQKWSNHILLLSSVQSLSHVQLCDPMDRSTPGLPVHQQVPEMLKLTSMSRWYHPTILSSVVPFSSIYTSTLVNIFQVYVLSFEYIYIYLSIYIYICICLQILLFKPKCEFQEHSSLTFFPLVYFLACSSTTLCCVSAGVSVLTTKEIVVYLTKHSGTGEMCHSKQNMSRR